MILHSNWPGALSCGRSRLVSIEFSGSSSSSNGYLLPYLPLPRYQRPHPTENLVNVVVNAPAVIAVASAALLCAAAYTLHFVTV